MSDTIYCYHCGHRHLISEMRRVSCGQIKRWRCRKSIEASQGSQSERDAFGRATHEANRQKNVSHNRPTVPNSVLDVLRALSRRIGHSL